MYTYERPFVGLRLSQFESSSKVAAWISELEELVMLDLSLEYLSPQTYDPAEYAELIHAETRAFLEWIVQNHSALKKLKFEFQNDYHGDGGEPVIFGRYLDDVYPRKNLHSAAAVKKLETIRATEERVQALFSTLPSKLYKTLKAFVGVGWMEHSS